MSKYVADGQTGYEADMDNMIQAIQGNCNESMPTVAAQGSPNMTVNVGGGVIHYNGQTVSSAGNATLAVTAADPTNNRVDLISVNSAGVVAITTGTPSATPKPPALPSTSILLAYISVAAASVNVQNSNITDRRITYGDSLMASGLEVNRPGPGSAGRTYIATDTNSIWRDDGSAVTQIVPPWNPNLVINSDFGRRTVWGLAMPEVFSDLNGMIKIDAGAAGSVGSNIFTQGAANNEYAWCAGSFVWKDGRASATFKATATGGIYSLVWRIDANNFIKVSQNVGTLYIQKLVGGSPTNVTSNAQALTLNRWYWLELDKQGTTVTVKIYDTGGTTPGVTKASSTLLQTLTATVADASVQVGAHISITSDQAAAQWGGIASGNGGVYVETWLPESYAVTMLGTLGGQAIGYDESADSGPIGKQNAMRVYIPAASRKMAVDTWTADGSVAPTVAYTGSVYVKVSGLGGSGSLVETVMYDEDSAKGNLHTLADMLDAGVTSWTRKSATATSASTARRAQLEFSFNTGSTATGTAFFMLPQLEQGSAATAWRESMYESVINAEVGRAAGSASVTTTSATMVEGDPRDLAINFFAPWDCVLDLRFATDTVNSGLNANYFDFTVDGTQLSGTTAMTLINVPIASKEVPVTMVARTRIAAGKHRIAVVWQVSAGTGTFGGTNRISKLYLTATRGK